MTKKALWVVIALAACGGHTPQPTSSDPGDESRQGSEIIPPEKMDEVTQSLKRRGTQVSHCLAIATENGEVKHGTRGRITFEIRVGTEGRAIHVGVITTDIQATSVVDCATKLVTDTSFPTLPRPYETSFTYGMEAN